MLRNFLILLFSLLTVGTAAAQSPPLGITPCASSSLSVSGTTGNTLLSACGTTTLLWNIGANEVFVALGTASTQAATTSNMSIPAGTSVTLNTSNSPLYLAAITGSSTSTLRITQGWGFPAMAGTGSSGGGGGGTVTGSISNGSDAVAPTTTNLGTNSYNYGWNGTAWDRLQVDGSKNLKVVVGGTLPAFATNPTVVALAVETNPTSTLTSGTGTAITSTNNFIASSVTAGSVVVPSFTATTVSGGNFLLRRARLTTNATSGWGSTFTINFWSAAPTYTNGDAAAYAVATGGAGHLGQCSITLTQYGDAASGECAPSVGNDIGVALASGQLVYWDLQATATLTKTSGQTFKITPEILDNQ